MISIGAAVPGDSSTEIGVLTAAALSAFLVPCISPLQASLLTKIVSDKDQVLKTWLQPFRIALCGILNLDNLYFC